MDNDILKQLAIDKELESCTHDPVYFMLRYVKIPHLTKDITEFHPYYCQSEVIYSYKKNKLNIVHGARQVGLTIFTAIYTLWYALFHPNKTIFIASSNLSDGQEILNKIKLAHEYIPGWLKPKARANLKRFIEFDNDSHIQIISSDSCGLRGCSIDLLWIDNFGHWNNHRQEEFYQTLIPHISNNSSVIITSSAVSSAGIFKRIFYDALKKRNKFIAHHISWNSFPGRGSEFKKDTIKQIGKICWEAEYECSAMIKEDHNGTREERKSQET